MKKIITILFLLLIVNSFSQIGFKKHNSRLINKTKAVDKKALEKFKKTTTIFTLPNTINKKVYEKILKDVWTVTPYKVVGAEEFNFKNYNKENYSFVELKAVIEVMNVSKGEIITNSHYTFYPMLNVSVEIIKKKKKRNIVIASAPFFTKREFYSIYKSKELNKKPVRKELIIDLYTKKDALENYTPGILKNYLQKINNLIINEKPYGYDSRKFSPEIAKLATTTLYVPKQIGFNHKTKLTTDDKINSLFKKYGYDYEIISNDDLSEKIMNNENIYYLYYHRFGTSRLFFRIINAKTGDILYNDYKLNSIFGPKSKQIKAIGNRIEKES